MPLKSGKSNKAVSSNIKTLVEDWRRSGKIGSSHPANKKAAVRQAVAISMSKAGRSRAQRGK